MDVEDDATQEQEVEEEQSATWQEVVEARGTGYVYHQEVISSRTQEECTFEFVYHPAGWDPRLPEAHFHPSEHFADGRTLPFETETMDADRWAEVVGNFETARREGREVLRPVMPKEVQAFLRELATKERVMIVEPASQISAKDSIDDRSQAALLSDPTPAPPPAEGASDTTVQKQTDEPSNPWLEVG